jgi:hypothetical protein
VACRPRRRRYRVLLSVSLERVARVVDTLSQSKAPHGTK